MRFHKEIIPDLVLLFQESNFVKDDYGSITIFEDLISLSDINRVYIISDVQKGITRGHHSHIQLHQILICLNGSITIDIDDGKSKKQVMLDSNKVALYIGPRIWRTMTWNDNYASLLVFASEIYDSEDYIRDYKSFLRTLEK